MSNATLAQTDLSTIDINEVKDELGRISDVFNDKLGKLNKAQFLNVLGNDSANYYGVDATLIVMEMIDKMFANTNYNESFFTYALVNRIEVEVARLS